MLCEKKMKNLLLFLKTMKTKTSWLQNLRQSNQIKILTKGVLIKSTINISSNSSYWIVVSEHWFCRELIKKLENQNEKLKREFMELKDKLEECLEKAKKHKQDKIDQFRNREDPNEEVKSIWILWPLWFCLSERTRIKILSAEDLILQERNCKHKESIRRLL